MARLLVLFFVAQIGLQASQAHLCSDGFGKHLCVDVCPEEQADRSASDAPAGDAAPAPQAQHECGQVQAYLSIKHPHPFFETIEFSKAPLPHTIFYQGLSDIFHPPA